MSYFHYQSSLGKLAITIVSDNITSLVFDGKKSGDDEGEATLTRKISKQLDEYFVGKRRIFELTLQYKGTPFQMKVWKYLQTIPYGKTVSYQTVAKSIGHPKSARAVGTACKCNPIPIIIPCHRVISSTGEIGEYAGGEARKIKLLKLEEFTLSFR
jgi:methylated-DNA-[protein]-cysteine S-methyltransferase